LSNAKDCKNVEYDKEYTSGEAKVVLWGICSVIKKIYNLSDGCPEFYKVTEAFDDLLPVTGQRTRDVTI
jgi:hypothetical protein